MAALVVDQLEAIGVAHDQRDRPPVHARLVLELGDACAQRDPVRKFGERVDDRGAARVHFETGDDHRDAAARDHHDQRVEQRERLVAYRVEIEAERDHEHDLSAEDHHQRRDPRGEHDARQQHRHDHDRQ